MKFNKTFSFIFYSLSIFIYLFIFQHNQTRFSLILFAIIFILLRKKLGKKLQYLDSKPFFLVSLFIYQMIFPINISQSMDTIQLLILSRKLLFVSMVLSLFVLFFILIHLDRFHLSYINPMNLSFNPMKLFKEKKQVYTNLYDDSRDKLNHKNIRYLVSEISRHGYLNYTSQYNISDEYFMLSEKSIRDDDKLYIILSKTGSPASDVISLFTQNDFNHLSLSFDRNLKTMVSYNGGNAVQKPGLNTEDLNSLQQKKDSQALVYSLIATKEQKEIILDQINAINREGSAYNVLGLITNHSVKPNMMFCSQFVYSMLQKAGIHFFENSQVQVRPIDFIENDYQQRLQFEYEIEFPKIPSENTNRL